MLADLSQELTAHIASFLSSESSSQRLSRYSTISRQWQYAIEHLTFRSIRLKNTELNEFSTIVIAHRRKALTRLQYEIQLPSYSDFACTRFEKKREQEANNRAFTEGITELFRVLALWERDGRFALTLLPPQSPMDKGRRPQPWTSKEEKPNLESYDLGERRYEHSFLQFDVVDLPLLSVVSRFDVSVYYGRKVAPSAVAVIISKLHDVEVVHLDLNDDEKKYLELRRTNRFEFAQQLVNLPKSIRTFVLNYYHESPSNQDFIPHSVLLPSQPHTDHLSIGLHGLSKFQYLKELRLNGPICISPSLFWPELESEETQFPVWPNLEVLVVEFSLDAPEGDWYFTRDPAIPPHEGQYESSASPSSSSSSSEEDDEDDEDDYKIGSGYDSIRKEKRLAGDSPRRSFRAYPVASRINPLLCAFGKAAARMPKIKQMVLQALNPTLDGTEFPYEFAVQYAPPSVRIPLHIADDIGGDSGRARMLCWMGAWRPNEEVVEVWKVALGHDVVIAYLDE